jgi:hypothetical protein
MRAGWLPYVLIVLDRVIQAMSYVECRESAYCVPLPPLPCSVHPLPACTNKSSQIHTII